MTDGQTLFVVFAALYLIESVRWLPARAWVCAAGGTRRRWRFRRPLRQTHAKGWELAILPVLPPVPAHLVALPWLLLPKAEGLQVDDEDGGQPVLLPWDDVAPTVEGATLFIARHQSLRLPSAAAAAALAQRLRRWISMDAAAREADFAAMARQSLDITAMRQLAEHLSGVTRHVRWFSLAIFVWCFGVITAIYRWLGDSTEVLIAAAVLLMLQVTQAVLFWRAAKTNPEAVKHRPWKTIAIACLPQFAMRAPDLLSKAVTATFHPLAARGLIDEASWLQMARHFWQTERFGPEDGNTPAVRAFREFFAAQQIDPAALEPAPARQPGSASYCPRCLSQFGDAAVACSDCGGVALRKWPAE